MRSGDGFIFVPDFCIVLKEISKYEGITATDIHHNTKITYSHIHHLKPILVEKGWITLQQDGVSIIMNLTDKGKEVVDAVDKLLHKIDMSEEDILKHRLGSRRRKVPVKVVHTNKEFKEAVQEAEQGAAIIFDEAAPIISEVKQENEKDRANQGNDI